MEFKESKIPNVFEIDFFHVEDERGGFVKTFHGQSFEINGLETSFRESFYSNSKKGVIRGMHFQLPPDDHAKLVYVTYGKVMDVVLDLRKFSPTFEKYIAVELSAENKKGIYIPRGCAHGFCALSDNATMTYLTSKEHKAENDSGILYNSFGYDWLIKKPILSERDNGFVDFNDFESPF